VVAPGILLVEGASDVDFFRALLPSLDLGMAVKISPPRDYGYGNTVTVVPELIPVLVKQLDTNVISRLAIVVDADHDSGGGFEPRWNQLTAVLRDHGYRCPERSPAEPNRGSIFLHDDGLPAVGLWLLPDHQSNGMLEDLVLSSAARSAEQSVLLDHAESAIRGLPHTLFSSRQHCKAVTYSWLSYQARPAIGLSAPIRAGLVDNAREPLRGLCDWLIRVFG
jgi:hypothetical protein